MQGIILEAAEPERLYAFATYVATLVARGEPVAVFVTGRAARAFSKNSPETGLPQPMDWRKILSDAKELGDVSIYMRDGGRGLRHIGVLARRRRRLHVQLSGKRK